MTSDLIVRYFHFIAIFVMFSLLTLEHFLLKGELEEKWLKKLFIIDLAYNISLVVALVCGIGLWLWVGKPAGFYSDNWVFHTKITLFFLVMLLSFFPAGYLFRQRRRQQKTITVPKSVIWVIRLELVLLAAIPLFAVLMANGMGYIH